MKKGVKLVVIGAVALLALALVVGLGRGQLLQAQEPAPQAALTGTGTGTAEGSGPEGGAPPAPEPEPDLVSAYVRIAGSTLKPRDSDVEWTHYGGGGGIYASSGDSYTWWNAGVYLPQGSTVTNLRVYVNDSNGTEYCRAYFTVYDLWGDVYQEWGGDSGGVSGEGFFDIAIPDHVINYNLYSYVVNWQPRDLGSDMALLGFRVYYTPPGGKAYLPSTPKDWP